jgi:Cytochrome C oxidase, cbb3-type, subunit III
MGCARRLFYGPLPLVAMRCRRKNLTSAPCVRMHKRLAQSMIGALAAFLVLCTAGCRQDMHDQAKYKPFRPSPFFADGRAARPLVADTVPRGHLEDDSPLYTGKVGEKFTELFPFPVTADVLRRGQERYNIYCSPCHDRTGGGGGMIVLRGYRRPPAFHTDHLRQKPVGYFFDVITHGFGVMPNYAQQIPPRDRWAIVGYVRALQLSQHAGLIDVPAAEQARLGSSQEAPSVSPLRPGEDQPGGKE